MLRNRLYYHLKPWLPQSLRLSVRGWLARRKRGRVGDIWPIMPGSERPPEGWPGWPEGKKFALVLTHDVEGQTGLDKIQKLIDLEKTLGFRSSFNFIPKGQYQTRHEIRESITQQGFEVAVHDLYHNGKLFLTRKEFSRNAPEINRQLKEWGAVGFRSGFMLHNLDWLHQLDIEYDLSTFDTDPFEPQPHGQNTIFPFWVPGLNGGQSTVDRSRTTDHRRTGYVELPYTLPQDSTLFLLLRERSPDIWIQKLDWIARCGAMALVNVHPDYMCFGSDGQEASRYPSGFYRDLLEYARRKYGNCLWQPLPREAANFYRKHYSAAQVPMPMASADDEFALIERVVSKGE